MSKPSVIIAGGGFAGLACALALEGRGLDVTLVDQRRSFEFIPNIHELISGLKKPAQLRLPLGPILRSCGHRFRQGLIVDIDTHRRSLTLADGRTFAADFLVLALGSSVAGFGVRGIQQHALTLKSVADGMAIHRRLRALKRGADPARVVVVGSGLAGIEALGEVLRLLPGGQSALHIVEAAPRLLPAAPAAVSRHLEDLCDRLQVTMHLGDPVRRIAAKSLRLESGLRLASDLTLWTGGPAPPALIETAGIAESNAWAAVDADLRLRGYEDVFVAGDSAQPGRPLSRQAYHALDMGACVGGNIARLASGRRTRGFRPRPRPTLMSFGSHGCMLITERRALFAPALAAAKEAVYAAVMAQLDRRQPLPRLQDLVRRGRASGEILWPLAMPRELLRGVAHTRIL
jgi:NADH dehydrogenase